MVLVHCTEVFSYCGTQLSINNLGQGIRGQREFSITGILDESQLHFFSLDHEKWFSKVSISSRNMRITIWNLVLVSNYENGFMIISISYRQVRATKMILNLVSKKLLLLSRVRVIPRQSCYLWFKTLNLLTRWLKAFFFMAFMATVKKINTYVLGEHDWVTSKCHFIKQNVEPSVFNRLI